MELFAALPPPPDPYDLFPQYAALKGRFLDSARGADFEQLEESFLALYAHVHGYEVPYTAVERRRVGGLNGYLCHVGGLSPILKAGPFIGTDTVSCDLGAGNGLQGLLLQYLYPHRRTVQIEMASRLVEAGKHLQQWLGIEEERVEWVAGDICDASLAEMDFVYLYRPVRPSELGRGVYEHLAAELESVDHPVVVFSIADCLRPFLSSRFEVFYDDGHLTCFRKRADDDVGGQGEKIAF
jgi:hypothetical protein